MEKENLAIRISGVKKEYRLGNIGGRTLQADLQSWFARKRGREDPNVKIGQDERLVGQKRCRKIDPAETAGTGDGTDRMRY